MAIQYNSNYDETIPFSDVCAQVAMQINVGESYTVPGAATQNYSARFSFASNSNVFVRLNAAATVPAAGTTATESYNEFRPETQRYVKGGDVIYFITPDATAYAGISLRALL
jgi:hypothetical protein